MLSPSAESGAALAGTARIPGTQSMDAIDSRPAEQIKKGKKRAMFHQEVEVAEFEVAHGSARASRSG